jgi:DNA-directed RNA polymerase specialized sigma24 family protein
MNQRKDANTGFWLPDRDSLGNPVDQRLIDAAHNIWERARLAVLRYLGEDVDAAEILEASVNSASRVMSSRSSIQFFETYLLRSVARESIRRLRRHRRVQYMEGLDIERLAGGVLPDIEKQWIRPSECRYCGPAWMSGDCPNRR